MIRHLASLHAHLMIETGWKTMFASASEMFGGDKNDGANEWFVQMQKQLTEYGRINVENVLKTHLIDRFLAQFERPLGRMRRILMSMEFIKWTMKMISEEFGKGEKRTKMDKTFSRN